MADVLLTHSYHLPYDPKQVRKIQPYAPLGTLYAPSALRAAHISVPVFDTILTAPHPWLSWCSNTSRAQARASKVRAGRQRTHPGPPFSSPPVNSSILNRAVKPGPRRTASFPQTLSKAADARIAATGAPSQSQGTSFRFALPGLSQRRFVS